MLVLQVIATAIILYYSYKWLSFRLKYDVHKLPCPPRLPLVGHLHHFVKMERLNQNKWFRDWYEKLGRPKIMLRSLPGDDALIIFDADYVKNKVLGKDGFPRDRLYKRVNKVFVGEHRKDITLTAKWSTPFSQAIRKAIATSFSTTHVRHAFPKVMMVVENAAARIEREAKQGPVDLQCLFTHMATDLVGRVAFDMDFGGISREGRIFECFVDAFSHFTDTLFKPHLQLYMKLFPNSKPALRKKASQEAIFAEHKHVTQTFMSRPYPPDNEYSLWANLRRMIDPDTKKPVEVEKLAGEVISMVGAAMDTTGHQMGWICAILSDHDETVDRILSDMKELGLYGPGSRPFEFADVAKLPFLTAVVKECMRVVDSLAALTSRCVPEDMEIFGYRLPKDMQVYVPSNVYSRMEEYFEDPDEFKPDRWLSGKSYEYFMPFSSGPRDCVGQRLAMLEMQLTLMHLLPRFKIKLADGYTFDDVMNKKYYESVMVAAKGGMNFEITPREYA